MAGKKGAKDAQKKAQLQQRKDQKNDKIAQKAGKIFGNDDIDAILKDFAEQDKKKSTTQIEVVENIPARINGTLSANPLDPYIFLHGGEHYNGLKVTTYNDCYLYNYEKNQYKHLTIPRSPLRSGHSSVIVQQGNDTFLYIFLGDFTSPSQLFKHFNDVWILNLTTHTFEQHLTGSGPPARSGHRIALAKRSVYLFGGFYDNHQNIRYYNDLWKFDLDTRAWTKCGPGAAVTGKKAQGMTAQEIAAANNALWPSARSGCGFVYHEATNALIMYGGYSTAQVKNSIEENASVLSDLWSYSLTTNTWTQLKQSNGPATPNGRAACTLLTYANHLLCFGGVKDIEKKIEKKPKVETADGEDNDEQQTPEDNKKGGKNAKNQKGKKGKKGAKDDEEDDYKTESQFYNDLLEYSFKHKRWFKLNINVGKLFEKSDKTANNTSNDVDQAELDATDPATTTKPKPSQQQPAAWGYMSSNKLQQEKLKEQQRLLMQRKKQLELEQEQALLKLVEDNKEQTTDADDDKEVKKKQPSTVTYLWGRRNAHATINKNGVLYLYGGAFERDNIEVILGDMHCLDLKKVFKNVDLDKDNTAYVAQQLATGGQANVTGEEATAAAATTTTSPTTKDGKQTKEEYAGSWMVVTEPDLEKFDWAGQDDDEGDSDEEEEFGYDSDSDDDDDDDDEEEEENAKKTRVPAIDGFETGKEYFKSCESFWISEALTEAPEDSTDKELRLFGFKLAKKYFEMMKQKKGGDKA